MVGPGKSAPDQGGYQGEKHKISCGHFVLTELILMFFRTRNVSFFVSSFLHKSDFNHFVLELYVITSFAYSIGLDNRNFFS